MKFDLSCYHLDDEYSFSPVEVPTSVEERTLIEQVDQVFLHSPGLLEKKGGINPQTELIPNGVDYEAYAAPGPIPPDLASIPRPWIGYSGYVKQQLDWPLLLHLVEMHRDWQFVFAGCVKKDAVTSQAVRAISAFPNAHFLGEKPVWELAASPQHFDVCIMPYRLDDYTKYIYPLKLHEYLAAGRPVVGARIRSLEDFADWIRLPTTREEWSAALADALRPEASSPELRTARQSVSRQYDWWILVEKIARILASRIGMEASQQIPHVRNNRAH